MTDVTANARQHRAEQRRFTVRKRTVFGAVTAAVAVGSIAPAGALSVIVGVSADQSGFR